MNLIKWNYNAPVWSNLFNDLLDETPWTPARTTSPATNIIRKEDAYVLEMAVPGFDKKDINVKVEDGVLTISSKKEEKNEENSKHYSRREFSFASFSRSFTLTDEIDAEKIHASYENGVLNVQLPIKEEQKVAKVKEIAVS